MSGDILIRGGNKLFGTIDIQGAKNSVLPILAASFLVKGESIINNCPIISDVDVMLRILEHLGCTTKREGNSVVIDASNPSRYDIPGSLMSELRSSVIFLGAILSRNGIVQMSYPGG